MKKILVSLLLLVPVFTGCAKVETDITLNDDKSVSVINTLSYDGNIEFDNDKDVKLLRVNYPKFLDKKYDIKSDVGEDFSKVVATKSVNNIEKEDLDLSSLGFSPANEASKRYVDVKKNLLITSYNIDILYNYQFVATKLSDVDEVLENTNVLYPEYYHKYGDVDEIEPPVDREVSLQTNLDSATREFTQETYANLNNDKSEQKISDNIDAVVRIKVPTFASYNNADSVKGNVYTWNIKKDGVTSIKLQYVQYSGLAIAGVLIIGALLLGLLAYRIVRHENQKRMDNIKNIV